MLMGELGMFRFILAFYTVVMIVGCSDHKVSYEPQQGQQYPPKAPSDLKAVAVQAFSVTLLWTDNSSDEDGFILQRDTDSNFTNPEEFSVPPGGGSTVTYTDTTVTQATQYYYRVKAFNKAGESGWSNVCAVKTPPNNQPDHLLWGGDEDDYAVAFLDDSGEFWLVGTTNSFGKSDGAIFFAELDSNWNLQNSWIWSLSGYRVAATKALYQNGKIFVAGTITDPSTNTMDILLLAFNTKTQSILWQEKVDVLGESEAVSDLVWDGSSLWVVGSGVAGSIAGQYPQSDIFVLKVNPTDGNLIKGYQIAGSILLGTVPTLDVAGGAIISGSTLTICGSAILVDLSSLNITPVLLFLQLDTNKGSVSARTYNLGGAAAFPSSVATDGTSFFLAGAYSSDIQALINWLQNPGGTPPPTEPFIAKLTTSACEYVKVVSINGMTSGAFWAIHLSGSTLHLAGSVTLSSSTAVLRLSCDESAASADAACWGTSSSAVALDSANRLVGSTSDYNGSWQTITTSFSTVSTSAETVSFTSGVLTVSAQAVSGTIETVSATTAGAGKTDALVVW
ncbi:MAG: hypothetical protein DRP82_06500 [Planctomycetota bacterium]|nr:MAG: hypothetical protein DRP82_06500 [Planctomycetota bacterium]